MGEILKKSVLPISQLIESDCLCGPTQDAAMDLKAGGGGENNISSGGGGEGYREPPQIRLKSLGHPPPLLFIM